MYNFEKKNQLYTDSISIVLGVSRHIVECGKGNFSVTPFYVLLNANEEVRKEKERFFINLNLN